jgi:hypothetical protein
LKIWSIRVLCEVPFQYFHFMNFSSFRESIWNIACVNLLWSLRIILKILVPDGTNLGLPFAQPFEGYPRTVPTGLIYGYPSSDFGDHPRISLKGLFWGNPWRVHLPSFLFGKLISIRYLKFLPEFCQVMIIDIHLYFK